MTYTFNPEQLKTFTCTVLERAGLSVSESGTVAESLIQAELRGVGSHGLTRLRTCSKRVKTKVVAVCVEPEIVPQAER